MILTVKREDILSALIFQAKNDARYYLNGVCFAPEGKLYSTDGHRAFIGNHESIKLKNNIIVYIQSVKFTKFDKAKINTQSGIVSYEDDAGFRLAVGLCKVVDGTFPDIEKLIPTEHEPVNEIKFHAGYLADIEKAAKIYDPKFPGMKIKTNTNYQASIIEIGNYSSKASVILMPMRT